MLERVPGGTFRPAQIAPSVSANAINAPPCRMLPPVVSAGAQSIRARTSLSAAAVTSMPSASQDSAPATHSRSIAAAAPRQAVCCVSMAPTQISSAPSHGGA